MEGYIVLGRGVRVTRDAAFGDVLEVYRDRERATLVARAVPRGRVVRVTIERTAEDAAQEPR